MLFDDEVDLKDQILEGDPLPDKVNALNPTGQSAELPLIVIE